MDLKITITLNDRLYELLEDKLPSLGKRVEWAVKRQIASEVHRQSEIEITPTPTPAGAEKTAEQMTAEEKDAAILKTAEKIKEHLGVQSVVVNDLRKPIKERVREIIDATRQRVHGDEADKHRPLFNQHMRQLAKCVGFEKPTDITDENALEEFIHRCGAMTFNGEKYESEAPF